ncbi:hypothetical protein Tco_1205128 [Tanacetum coccineum]
MQLSISSRNEEMVPTLWSPSNVGVMTSAKILGVKSVSVKKLHGYGHLEEIVVKRADRQLYNDIVDFIVALRMFIRSLIMKRRVEDLQLGVKSYQKKT